MTMIRLRQIARLSGACPLKTDVDGFTERICGNYELMWLEVSQRRLFHLLVAQDGGPGRDSRLATVLVQNIEIRQQAQLDIVNQLVNRMKEVVRGPAYYQDQVFVSAVLKKLGIRNQQEFIHMVAQAAGISLEKRELVRLFKGSKKLLRRIRQMMEGRRLLRRPGREGASAQSEYYLHYIICERLGLVSLYQKLHRLAVPYIGDERAPADIFPVVAENMTFMDNLAASRIGRAAFGIGETQIFQSFNPYEMWDARSKYITEEKIKEDLSCAILLNLVRDVCIYEAVGKGNEPAGGGSLWLNIRELTERSSQQSARRFFLCHRSMQTADMENQKELVEVIHDGFTREVRILNSIRDITGRQEPGEDIRELRKTRTIITDILEERQDKLQEELLAQTGRMLYAVTQVEEEIHRYILYTDVREASKRQWSAASGSPAAMVHVQADTAPKKKTPAASYSSHSQAVRQDVELRSQNYTDKKKVRMDLAGQSRKEVSRLVKDNIQEQMNVLTDKVYTRLERRLINEKKKRGM